ncbi:MAG: hypothetical protein GY771_12435 [bacterium]|nr:hypothetical protein [bacterium]
MRCIMAILVTTLFAFTFAVYAIDPQPSPGKKEVSVELTSDQVKNIEAAKGKEITVTLTPEQIEGIQKEVPDFDLRSFSMSTKHLRSGNVVTVEIVMKSRSINPIPSP